MKIVPTRPSKTMINFIHKVYVCRKIPNEVDMKNHIINMEMYFAFIGIPWPDLYCETLSPKRGCLITQLYIVVELRKKQAAAKIINIVVGKPGIMIPIRPNPVRKRPIEKYISLKIGIFFNKIFIYTDFIGFHI